MISSFLSFTYEIGQRLNYFDGTFDVLDLISYHLAFASLNVNAKKNNLPLNVLKRQNGWVFGMNYSNNLKKDLDFENLIAKFMRTAVLFYDSFFMLIKLLILNLSGGYFIFRWSIVYFFYHTGICQKRRFTIS